MAPNRSSYPCSNLSILEAVKCFLAESKKVQLKPIKVPALVEKFLADIREKEKSRRYILDMQARLHKAAKTFSGYVGEIHAEQIDRWLSLMKETSGRTKNNYRAALATLFSFARQTGHLHLPRGQQTEVEFSTRYNGKGGEIGAFAGLRSAEIVRLEWQEVRFDQDVIELKAAKAKTASRRLAPILPASRAWLSPMRKESGKVLASGGPRRIRSRHPIQKSGGCDYGPRRRAAGQDRSQRPATFVHNLPDGGSQECRAGCAGGWEQPANDFRALS
jgi:integrase